MASRIRPRSGALVALALGLILTSCGSAAAPAATLGDTEVSDAQLAHEMDVFSFLQGLNQQSCGTAEGDETADAACARFSLANLIQEHFVGVYATAHDISVPGAQIQTTIDQLDGNLGKKAVDDQLAKFHLTRADLTDIARRILLFGQVQTAVTEAQVDLRQLYQDSILEYTTVQVDHILVKTKAEAEAAYRQVTAPGATEQDFLALAKQISIDPSADQNSGSLGSAVASTYVTEFGQAAAALDPGEISKPVHTEFGWHVIRMVKKDVQSFDAAKQALISSSSSTVFNDWLRERIEAEGVEVNPKYGRFDPETFGVTRISSTATGSASPSASPSA